MRRKNPSDDVSSGAGTNMSEFRQRKWPRLDQKQRDSSREFSSNDDDLAVGRDDRNVNEQNIASKKVAKSAVYHPTFEKKASQQQSSGSRSAHPSSAAQGKTPSFPEKIMDLLENGEAMRSLWWLSKGTAFAIDRTNFSEDVLDKSFQGNKFDSFIRTLRRWGFKRLPGQGGNSNIMAFYNPMFQKNAPHLLQEMIGRKDGDDSGQGTDSHLTSISSPTSATISDPLYQLPTSSASASVMQRKMAKEVLLHSKLAEKQKQQREQAASAFQNAVDQQSRLLLQGQRMQAAIRERQRLIDSDQLAQHFPVQQRQSLATSDFLAAKAALLEGQQHFNAENLSQLAQLQTAERKRSQQQRLLEAISASTFGGVRSDFSRTGFSFESSMLPSNRSVSPRTLGAATDPISFMNQLEVARLRELVQNSSDRQSEE